MTVVVELDRERRVAVEADARERMHRMARAWRDAHPETPTGDVSSVALAMSIDLWTQSVDALHTLDDEPGPP